jgi:hypothetical protein
MPGHDLDNWLEATACLNANIPRDCSHRRLHRYVSEPQAGKSRAASAEQTPRQPPKPAGPPSRPARKRR